MELALSEKEGKMVLDTAALEAAIREGTLTAIRAEMAGALEAERKRLFPSGDGKEVETLGGSVIDTSFFDKKLYSAPRGQLTGPDLASKLVSFGGPWLKLSPAMQKFADFVKKGLQAKFDLNTMQANRFSLIDYNQEISEWNTKFATMGGLTTTDVGAIVPIEFVATVIEFAILASEILPKLWRIPMSTMTTRIPTLSQSAGSYFGGIVLYHPTEAQEKWATKPGFSYKEFKAHKLIGLCPMTDELVMDSSIGIINYLTGLFTRAFQFKTEFEVLQGNGASKEQFLGITNDPGVNQVTRDAQLTIRRADVLNLESAIDENIQDLTYITRRSTFNTLRQEKQSGTAPLYYETFREATGVKPEVTLNGYQCIRTRNCPQIAHQGDLICGDLGYYMWALRQDMTIDMSRERYFEYDMTALRFVMRQDGMAGVPIAFAVTSGPAQS